MGVPVNTKSSSSSGNTPLKYFRISGTVKSIEAVDPSCLTLPLTDRCIRTLPSFGFGMRDLGIEWETGRKVLSPLESDHGRPFARADVWSFGLVS
jgi:hypothetical protein